MLIGLGLTFALMVALALWFRWRNQTALPVIQPDGRGSLQLPRAPVAFFVLCFFAMTLILGAGAWSGGGQAAWLGACVTGLIGTALLLITTPAYNLEWDEDGVIGPSGYGLLPVGARPVFLTWDEIRSVHVDRLGSHVLTGRNKRRIVVYSAYGGKRIFLKILHAFRPDLGVMAD